MTALYQILLKGEEYLLKRYLQKLIREKVDDSARDFNFERHSARDKSASEFLSILSIQPWMAESRMVILEDIEAYKKDDWEILRAWIKNPSPTTHVILIGASIDRRIAFFKDFLTVGEIIEFKTPYEREIPNFLHVEAKALGIRLAEGCTDLLLTCLGTHLACLVSELEKLKLYVSPSVLVTPEHVFDLVGGGVIKNLFVLNRFIAEKNYFEAKNVLRIMEEQGESAVRIVSLIVAHFRKLLLIQGAPAGKGLAGLIGVSPYFLKEYVAQAKNFNGPVLKHVYQRLMALSIAMRSTGPDAFTLLESFVQDVCLL